MVERTSIKLTCAALDERDQEIVLRGVIDPDSLALLQVAEYQREELPQSRIGPLMVAIQAGGVPDLQLGCRGGDFRERDGAFYIADAVFIIDGLQRRTAALKLIAKGIVPHLGATVYFNTTEELERQRFRALNVTRVKLSPNVLLRNLRHESAVLQALYQLCLSSQFAFNRKVCWSQRMKRGELLTAMMLTKVVAYVHRRFASGLGEHSHGKVIAGLDRAMNRIGRSVMIANCREYFEVVEFCFRTGDIVYRESAPSLRGGFLYTLAQVFGSFEDFWQDAEFHVPSDLRRKLAQFPLQDPHIEALCGSTGSSQKILFNLIVEHLNKGKKTKHLKSFRAPVYEDLDEQETAPADNVPASTPQAAL